MQVEVAVALEVRVAQVVVEPQGTIQLVSREQ
jgi:hypothetical protein